MNKDNLKHRVVGSIALVSFFVILIPIILEYKDRGPPEETFIQKDGTTNEVGLNENKNQSDPLFVAPLKEEKALTNSEYLLQELNETLAQSKPKDVQPSTNIPKSESWILQHLQVPRSPQWLASNSFLIPIHVDPILIRMNQYPPKNIENERIKI